MFSNMDPALEVINRTLERESWARDKLALHAGRVLVLVVGPARLAYAIDDGGRLRHSDAAPDLTLRVSPLRLPALLAQPDRWQELVAADGDAALAATLAELALMLPMLVEQAFARTLGPIVGQRIAEAGRQLLAMPDYVARRFGNSFARYVGDEIEVAVRGSEARAFAADVATLAERVDALSTRIDALGGPASPDRSR
jgi:ubiquinone biosynthesis accessory factor UbiJ